MLPKCSSVYLAKVLSKAISRTLKASKAWRTTAGIIEAWPRPLRQKEKESWRTSCSCSSAIVQLQTHLEGLKPLFVCFSTPHEISLFSRGKYIPSRPRHTFLIIFTITSQLFLRLGRQPRPEAKTHGHVQLSLREEVTCTRFWRI